MSARVVTATFRVVTPLFLGGAEPSKDCELRTASIKGALVFWWRALQGVGLDRRALTRAERTLFGSSEGGQSRWLLDARGEALTRGQGKLDLDAGRGYLAGQGLAQPSKNPLQPHHGRPQRPFAGGGGAAHQPKPFESRRPYLRSGGRIVLRAFRRLPSSDGADAEAIRDAMLALATFGGLGSRSRRGFGSLHLEQLTCAGGDRGREELKAPTSLEDVSRRISGLLDGISYAALPEFTHFSDGTRIVVLEAPGTSAEDLHEELGRSFKEFRSHDLSGGVGEADHDDVARWLRDETLDAPPRRAAFGLPHNYYFSSSGTSVWVNAARKNRRASPLFVHLDEVGDDDQRRAVAVITFLPAAFLPPGEQIQLKERGRSKCLSPRAVPELWQPVHDWLDELKSRPPRDAAVWEKP